MQYKFERCEKADIANLLQANEHASATNTAKMLEAGLMVGERTPTKETIPNITKEIKDVKEKKTKVEKSKETTKKRNSKTNETNQTKLSATKSFNDLFAKKVQTISQQVSFNRPNGEI